MMRPAGVTVERRCRPSFESIRASPIEHSAGSEDFSASHDVPRRRKGWTFGPVLQGHLFAFQHKLKYHALSNVHLIFLSPRQLSAMQSRKERCCRFVPVSCAYGLDTQ